jgi:hypothetical protein
MNVSLGRLELKPHIKTDAVVVASFLAAVFFVLSLSATHVQPGLRLLLTLGAFTAAYFARLTGYGRRWGTPLVLDGQFLIGPTGEPGRSSRLPVAGLYLDPIFNRAAAHRLTGPIELTGPAGGGIVFRAGLYEERALLSFFQAVRARQEPAA